ncbi:hypothetical protein TNCV_926461 [Trichonephila clavipes]|nr:hypothetical protein TNCV_926461 [Trichonephila clavipes]
MTVLVGTVVVLLLMPPDRQCQIEAHEIHRGKELEVHLSLAVVLSTIHVTVRFSSLTMLAGGKELRVKKLVGDLKLRNETGTFETDSVERGNDVCEWSYSRTRERRFCQVMGLSLDATKDVSCSGINPR